MLPGGQVSNTEDRYSYIVDFFSGENLAAIRMIIIIIVHSDSLGSLIPLFKLFRF